MGKLANPCAKSDIIDRLSTGESSNQIANDYNVSGQRIRQIKKENRELIEQKAQELLKNLPDIVETAKQDIQIAKYISNKLKDKLKLDELSKEQLRAVNSKLNFKTLTNNLSADILRLLGIFPAQSPSLFIQNIYNDNQQQTLITPEFQEFLDWKAQKLIDNSVDYQNET